VVQTCQRTGRTEPAAPLRPASPIRAVSSEATTHAVRGRAVAPGPHSPSRTSDVDSQSRLSRWVSSSLESLPSGSSPIVINTDLDVHAKDFTPQSRGHAALGSAHVAAEHLVRTAPIVHTDSTATVRVAPSVRAASTVPAPTMPSSSIDDPKPITKRPGSNILSLSAVVPPPCPHSSDALVLAVETERLRRELEVGHLRWLQSVKFAAACSNWHWQVPFPAIQAGRVQ
jgi:hypothetical protein